MFDGSLPEIADYSALSDAELVLASAGWGRAESAAAARKLAAMAELFRRRTGLEDAVERENWFIDAETNVLADLAGAHHITESLARHQTQRGVMLADRFPRVAALFEAGLINDMLIRAIVYRTYLITDPDAMAAVDAALAEQVLAWGPKSQSKTEEAIDALVEIHDPGALRRREPTTQTRNLEFGTITDDAGIMTVYARMYSPDGAALKDRVQTMARSVCPDDPRPMKERLNDALAALSAGTALRCECDNPDCPATSLDRPPSNVILHLIATEEGLDKALHAHTQAEAGSEEVEPDPAGQQDEPAGETPDGAGATATASTPPTPTATPALGYAFGAGVLSPRVLLALFDRAKIHRLEHPGDAPPEPRYRPSAALQDFVRCRDLTCRFPGCDQPAHRCDLDHAVPYPAGPTCASNLRCLCRKHHLLKTFWTGKTGWRDRQSPDGTIVWTSPTGQSYTTHPGSALLFPTLCIPTAPAPLRPDQTTELMKGRGLNMPRRRHTRAENRARYIQAERRLNDDLVAERNKPSPF
ncbi:HNH endonuclease signature motif containing protein [Mycobacterium sp. IS-1742]|uniref:HNH endonuclease signature motif containing protein n=1 Tax=Mycobacterium sp. IS-1742 TaxID=1772285 RepID=UPI000A9BA922|nr:HNH endonuclease signature motif containing protein [Mycobacterium sp. IS-1742]